jgi:uncharacterized protein (TIGR02996 family)
VSDECDFLAHLRAHPWDDVARMVYADWLDENGQPEKARFLRALACFHAAVTDAALRWPDDRRGATYRALCRELWEARNALDPAWLAAVSERPTLFPVEKRKASLFKNLWTWIIEG